IKHRQFREVLHLELRIGRVAAGLKRVEFFAEIAAAEISRTHADALRERNADVCRNVGMSRTDHLASRSGKTRMLAGGVHFRNPAPARPHGMTAATGITAVVV